MFTAGATEPYNFASLSHHMFSRFAVVKLTKSSSLHLQMLLSCQILPQADVPVASPLANTSSAELRL